MIIERLSSFLDLTQAWLITCIALGSIVIGCGLLG